MCSGVEQYLDYDGKLIVQTTGITLLSTMEVCMSAISIKHGRQIVQLHSPIEYPFTLSGISTLTDLFPSFFTLTISREIELSGVIERGDMS